MKNTDHLTHDSIGHSHEAHGHHDHSLKEELVTHLPYAIFSVAFGLILLTLLSYFSLSNTDAKMFKKGYMMLFHSFHFLHVLFASTGTVLTFLRFSSNRLKAVVVGVISPVIFCILSDIFLPYIGGMILGQTMSLHICFVNEWVNVVPFLIVGMLNGFLLASHFSEFGRIFSVGSHFAHILISSLASLFYMVSHGFNNWQPQMGLVFIVLILAVLLPCTLSDVVVPMYFAGAKKK